MENRMWAMERVADWISNGCRSDDPVNLPAKTLQLIEQDGLIKLGNKEGSFVATLTPLGAYEANRLRAFPPPPADEQPS